MPLINHAGGGGGTPQLCGQVENFKVAAGNSSAILSWTAPNPDEDNSFVGARIVRKVGSAPTGINDGTVVYEGTALTYTDTGLTAGTTYYYRAFAYNAKKKYQTEYRVVSLTAVSADPIFNNNSWNTIKILSDTGQAPNLWAIGDRKQITLNGAVDETTFADVITYAFIIGFNHNSNYEGSNRIHLQIGKTALTGGKDICFGDSGYDGASSPSGRYFGMNSAQTSVGGWKNSKMRKEILGTSLTSYYGTFIGCLPADFRAVLKSVTKYSDNHARDAAASVETNVTATEDYMFLLSEYEVYGSNTYANSYEQNKQEQYAYYSAGNSKVKYYYTVLTKAAWQWLRSNAYTPYGGNVQFCSINSAGAIGYDYANFPLAIAPCCCV